MIKVISPLVVTSLQSEKVWRTFICRKPVTVSLHTSCADGVLQNMWMFERERQPWVETRPGGLRARWGVELSGASVGGGCGLKTRCVFSTTETEWRKSWKHGGRCWDCLVPHWNVMKEEEEEEEEGSCSASVNRLQSLDAALSAGRRSTPPPPLTTRLRFLSRLNIAKHLQLWFQVFGRLPLWH